MAQKDPYPRPRTNLRGMQTYLNLLEAPRVERRRQTAIIAALAFAVAAMATTIAVMAPLKERVPYFLEVERATGRVELSDQAARQYVPDEAAIRYFLGRWVVDAYSIDDALRPRLQNAYSYMRGEAGPQFERLILQNEDPLGKLSGNPQYRRSVEIVSPPQIVAEGSALIRIALVEGRTVVGRRQINLKYALIPPTKDEELLRNPIGLWITDFSAVNEAL